MVWIFIVVVVYLLDTILVSALQPTSAMLHMRKTLPFLCNRCVTPVTHAGYSMGFHMNPPLISKLRGGSDMSQPTQKLSRTFCGSISNENIPDSVKRFKVSDEQGREQSSIPHEVLKVRRSPFPLEIDMQPTECKPWLADWSLIVEACADVYFELGDGCSESAYQTALLYALYRMHIPAIVERPVYATTQGMTVLKGRVDMEISGRFILEFKVSPPTATRLRADKKQLRRYISAYKQNGTRLERAALVYFGNNEVRIVEVSVTEEDIRAKPY
jgi:GxxExxY protein